MALLPVLTDLIKEYGPQLIAFAKDAAKWIVSDLVPAIKTTAEWIADELIPAITLVVEWIVVNLVPAIQDLAKWIQTDLIPAIVTVVKWLVENLGPIIQDVARWIQTDFIPAVQAIVQWLSVNLPPAIEFAGRVFNDLKARIDGITSAIRTAIQWVSDLIERLRNLRMPSLNLGGLGLQRPERRAGFRRGGRIRRDGDAGASGHGRRRDLQYHDQRAGRRSAGGQDGGARRAGDGPRQRDALMPYVLYQFGSLVLPEYNAENDVSTGQVAPVFLDLPGGGVFDVLGTEPAKRRITPINKRCTLDATDTTDMRTQYNALRATIGHRDRLWRKWDSGLL